MSHNIGRLEEYVEADTRGSRRLVHIEAHEDFGRRVPSILQSADDGIRLKLYPTPKTPFQTIFGEGPDNSGAIRDSLVRVLQIVQPMARFARDVGLVEQPGALMTPQVPTAN